MIVTTESNQKTTSQGNIQSQNFTINATPEAFALLAGGYTDIIGSIIRELSSNAADAHNEVNKKYLPFDIYLPNMISPEFKIRDYGPGMSKDDVINIFSSMFTSTKRDNNDNIGGFGIGGKTPLAYHTKTMTIECYQQNVKTTYLAFINDEGYPSINILGEQATEKPTGFMLKFPVKDDDFNSFNTKTKEQLKYFVVKPTIYGVNNTTDFFKTNKSADVDIIKETNYTIEYSSSRYYNNNGVTVIQGGIGYSVKIDTLINYFKISKVTNQLLEYENVDLDDLFAHAKFKLYVNIGDVALDLTREHIKEDDKTLAAITDIYIKAHNTLITKIFKDKNKCKTFKDAKTFLDQYQIKQIFKYRKYNKWLLEYSLIKNKYSIVIEHSINTVSAINDGYNYKSSSSFWFNNRYEYNNARPLEFNYTLTKEIFNKDSVFIINDLVGVKGIKQRIENAKNKYSHGIIFNPYKNKFNGIIFKALKNTLIRIVGNKPLLLLSQITQQSVIAKGSKVQSTSHLVGVRTVYDGLVYPQDIINKPFKIYSLNQFTGNTIEKLFPTYADNFYYMTEVAEKKYAKKFNFIKIDEDFYEKRFLKFQKPYLQYKFYTIITNNIKNYFIINGNSLEIKEIYKLLFKAKSGKALLKDFNITSLSSFIDTYKQGKTNWLKDIDTFNTISSPSIINIQNLSLKHINISAKLVKNLPNLGAFYTESSDEYFIKLFKKTIGA